jgi:hypothetical protein
MRLPQLDEVLEIADDGSFSLWRSVSTAASPPSPIGSFAGQMTEEQWSELDAAGQKAVAEGSRTWVALPDSPIDRLQVGAAEATLGMREPAEGAWATLAALLRPLLADLTSSPRAAIALEVDDGARLVHRGHEELKVDLSDLALEAVQWRGDDAEARWAAQPPSEGKEVLGPGWTKELPLDHGFELQDGDRLSVAVTFRVRSGKRWVPVSLRAP